MAGAFIKPIKTTFPTAQPEKAACVFMNAIQVRTLPREFLLPGLCL
jgi:hypothetical protein